MQGSTFAFQVFQVLRYGSMMLVAIAFAWLKAPQTLIDDYEVLVLIGGSTTFFWVGGLLDGYLLLQKKSDGLHALQSRAHTFRWFLILGSQSAMAFALLGWAFYPELSPSLICSYGLYLWLETVTQSLPYFLIASQQPTKLLIYALSSSLAFCLAVIVPLAMHHDLGVILWVLAGVALLKFAWLLWEVQGLGKGAAALPGFGRDLWRISLPLILATLLGQGAVYIDGFLVERFFPTDFVDFRYGAKEFPLVLLLANSMSVVRASEIAQGMRENALEGPLQALRHSSNRLIYTLFPLCMAFMLLSGPLFDFFFKGRFPLAVPVFDLFLLLAIPRLMFPQSVVRGFQQTHIMSISAGIELILNVALSLVFMHYYGIAGIAGGTVLAYIFEKVLLLAYTHFKLGIAWHRYASVPLWFAASGLLILIWLLKYLWMPHLFI